ncbi:MAG: multidrug efflux pump [Methylobacteriaceae bacterium]|nr:multidrug efflux pump [Methylobacteriaceae bacterium]
MNFSDVFIRRPVGTILISIGILLVGIVAYRLLPVASLPSVDIPTIRVTASRPGADPATMAKSVAAPLERRLGEIAGVTEITSVSSLGTSMITIQFDLSRNADGAARDVQAALNAAATDLPSDLPTLPLFRKTNPAASPILVLALTSDTLGPSAIYDAADTVLAQRLSQVDGVAEVSVNGADQPAMRIRADPQRLAAMGVSLEDIRNTITNANSLAPLGLIDNEDRAHTLGANGQLTKPEDFANLIVRNSNGAGVRLSFVADIQRGVRNTRSSATFNGKPSVLLVVTKQAGANVIETVDRIYALLPELKRWTPAGINIEVLTDRTKTIRASVAELQLTLAVTIVLVMLVVYVFLRRTPPTLAAGVTVPLSLAGTAAAMWCVGFSIDNISLMALVISVGFVVDDAIVMIENVFRNIEGGMTPWQAARAGSRQIGFTVFSISLSLIAAFTPLLFMGGLVGRLFREFSVTLAFAIVVSTFVSLTVTPMICAHFVKHDTRVTWLDRIVEGVLNRVIAAYAASLDVVLRRRGWTLLVAVATVAATVVLFIKTPKGFFPQDDTGFIFGMTEAASDISFPAMAKLQQRAAEIVRADPAVASVGSSVGSSGFNASVNQGRLFISVKPIEQRDNLPITRVAERLRQKLGQVAGISTFLVPTADLRIGGRQSKAQYQFTLWDQDFDELARNVPPILERIRQIPGLRDVSTDRESNGLEANVMVDRAAASRLGVQVQAIDDTLNDAFAQRQIATIYTPRNQYRIVIEIDPNLQKSPRDLDQVYVPSNAGTQVPLSAVSKVETRTSALVINHQGQFPSITITYNLAPDMMLADATEAITNVMAGMHLPDGLQADFAGDARAFRASAGAQPLLIITALLAVYIVLGVLYESLAHPLTIISTLPSAGLGALLALNWTHTDLSIIAFIGIILLIGIVKKNGIMLVDFALEAERNQGMTPEQSIYRACVLRFRPILMTTMAAVLGALPLMIGTGTGSELRHPLGIAIVGGLLASQVLTLFTTPVIYLWFDRLAQRFAGSGFFNTGDGQIAP